MSKKQDDGTSLRSHLEAAERMRSGITRGALEKHKLPPEAAFVWAWYLDLSTCRQYMPMSGSPMRLSCSEILAWSTLHQIVLEPWQLRTIRLIDSHHVHVMMAPEKTEPEGL